MLFAPKNFGMECPPDDPARLSAFLIPAAYSVPLEDSSGTGQVHNSTPSDGANAITVGASEQPEPSGRELIIVQTDNASEDLVCVWTVAFKNIYGKTITATITLTGTETYVFAEPCVEVVSASFTASNADNINDTVKLGYRGWYLMETYVPAGETDKIITERVNKVKPTAGTIPQDNFYLPDSISAGQEIFLLIRNEYHDPVYLRDGLATTGTLTDSQP